MSLKLSRLFITANSPGEVAGWLAPIVKALRQRNPRCRVTVILLPCPFATGSEKRILQDDLHVDEIIPASGYLGLFFRDKAYWQDAALIHLGGDLMYSAALLWRWGIPAWSYLWGRKWWDRFFKGYFIKSESHLEWMANHKLPLEKAVLTGDLVVDDVRYTMDEYLQGHAPIPQDPDLITFLPGSRLIELESLSPFFLKTAAVMLCSRPELRFQMIISPFIEPARLVLALQAPPHLPEMDGVQGRIVSVINETTKQFDEYLVGENVRIKLIRRHRLPHLAASAMCATIPGTKTAEAASLGVPELMVLPLNRPECLPYIGLLGLLDWVPGGRWLKGRILMSMRSKASFIALPNILAKKYVIPEIIDIITPEQIASAALQLLADPAALAKQKEEFARLYAPSRGSADRILDTLEAYFGS
ncbi:hypothetical protein IJT93_11235 [bacterium]|nr:hypothetical protein [bacterium]